MAAAARLCYSPVGASELSERMTDEQVDKLLTRLRTSHHDSPLEHVSFTFAIEGISRALSHQLVRHRIASYSQQSQRYVQEDAFDYIVPEAIQQNSRALTIFEKMMADAQKAYSDLIEEGIKAEDARYVLPNAAETKIVVTMNARTLLHYFAERCCSRAQLEHQRLANAMLAEVVQIAPVLFHGAGAPCISGTCPEGSMSCGKPKK